MDNKIFIKELSKKYQEGDLIPFIGAGFSVPFKIPNWETLIRDCAIDFGIENVNGTNFLQTIDFDLKNYDYWSAVDNVKKYLNRSDEDIQDFIVEKILAQLESCDKNIDNNYKDLDVSGFNIYFTTNYDHLLSENVKTVFQGSNLKDLKENIQKLVADKTNKRIFHLHGNITDRSSIVISSKMYDELYKMENYQKLFGLFGGTKTFIFLGFSFSDLYIQQIIKKNKSVFKSKHYIILPNPSDDMVKTLKSEYNIETLGYNPSKSSHQEEIRKILNQICSDSMNDNDNDVLEHQFEVLPEKSEKSELENSLFCKKLRLEDIHNLRVDCSKEYFFMAEQYLRWLKKSGIKDCEVVAEYMLQRAYLKYKDEILEALQHNDSPDELWIKVHNELKKLELDKVSDIINDECMPDEYNKQGFIHVLADSEFSSKEVWWGDKRFE